MICFVPHIALPTEVAPQTSVEDKFGGIPWGLPATLWPVCSKCGGSQTLLAQFTHHSQRLDLGRIGRVLLVFQCNHNPGMCETWTGGSGANSCFILESEDLIDGPTPIPDDDPPVEQEVRIVHWEAKEDGVPESAAFSFFDDAEHLQILKKNPSRPLPVTRLGSVPTWMQSTDDAPRDGWRFIGQLDSYYSFYSKPKGLIDGIYSDEDHTAGRTHFCEGPNFGDMGIGYIFLKFSDGIPQGYFFWQCG
ncbi:MAG: hypothetical protein HZA46_14215 [Planctomycetales bacterium]|nr:hypothetical protein [Planctomycetales bacterium]